MSREAEPSHEQRLHAILADYLQAAESGQPPDRQQLLSAHPEVADDLRTFFADHDRMHRAAEPFRTATETPARHHVGTETLVPTEPFPVSVSLDPGHSFGDYELLEEIARGGMGVVFKARQKSLNRVVALKMVLSGQLAGETELRRFKAEAEAAANLDHPNIVPIYEVGEHAGQHFFSMKLIEGGSLAALCREPAVRPDDQRRAAQLMVTVARAVHHAHQHGILHRDLKPANILLASGGAHGASGGRKPPECAALSGVTQRPPLAQYEPHVTDFGLAKRVQGGGELTHTGTVVGTPSYMAPEQAGGKPGLSTAADTYSLGAILYELLTGRPPFKAESILDTLLQVLEREPARPRLLNPHTNPDLETICLKCLEKDPQKRYPSAEELARDLERWLGGEPIVARRAGRWERAVKWMKRRPAASALVGVSAASAAALLVLAGFLWINAEQRAQAVEDLAMARQQQKEAGNEAARQQRLAQEKRTEVERLRQIAEQEKDAARAARETARRTLYAADMQFARAAWETDDVPRLLAMLERHRPGPGLPDLRGFEWHYLRRLAHEAKASFLAHREPDKPKADREDDPLGARPVLLALSADGTTLASTVPGDPVKLWKLPAGEPAGRLPRPTGALLSLAFAGGKQLGMLTKAPGQEPARPSPADIQQVVSGKAAPSLRWLTEPLALRTFGLNGKPASRPAPYNPADFAVPLSVLTAGMEAANVLLTRPLPLKDHLLSPLCLARSPDRKTLAVGGIVTPVPFNPPLQKQEGGVLLWDLTAGREVALLKGFPSAVTFAAFAPDGRTLAVAALDSTVRLWDVATRKERATLGGHAALVLCLAYSGDGALLASGAADGVVKLWDVTTGQLRRTFKGHQKSATAVLLAPDGRTLVSASVDGVVKVWDTAAEQGPVRVKGVDQSIQALAFAPDGRSLAAADRGGKVVLSDPATGRSRGKATVANTFATCAAFSPDCRTVALGTINGTVVVCDAATGRERFSRKAPGGLIYALVFAPDGKLLAAGSGEGRKAGAVTVWDAEGKERWSARGHGNHVKCLAFSPDGKTLVSGSADRSLRLWEVGTGKERLAIKDLPQGVNAVRFSPDGRRLAHASADGITLRDGTSGREVLKIRSFAHHAVHLAFSPDGQRLASAGGEGSLGKGGGVKVWDTKLGLEVLALGGANDSISAVAFSPDGQRLAAASQSGTSFNFLGFPGGEVTVWDATPLP